MVSLPKSSRNIHASKPAQKKASDAAFHEVFTNTPSTVDKSKSAAGQRRQKIAIALSKAGLSRPGKGK